MIYSKQSGDEPRTPLTVRVEWQPDGTVAPLMYWTPDGARYRIVRQSESVGLAYLKDGGVGLRFKVRAELVDAPDDYSDAVGTRLETYLYLADERFSQRDIIDARYAHAGKEYIAVVLDVFADGDYEVAGFTVRGQRYVVDKTLAVERRGTFRAGGIGVCHRVMARAVRNNCDDNADPQNTATRVANLYWELNKWFVMTE